MASPLRGLHLDIESGGCLALVGASGWARARHCGLLPACGSRIFGRILCDGHDITHTPPDERRFGMVRQQNTLIQARHAGAHIALPLHSVVSHWPTSTNGFVPKPTTSRSSTYCGATEDRCRVTMVTFLFTDVVAFESSLG